MADKYTYSFDLTPYMDQPEAKPEGLFGKSTKDKVEESKSMYQEMADMLKAYWSGTDNTPEFKPSAPFVDDDVEMSIYDQYADVTPAYAEDMIQGLDDAAAFRDAWGIETSLRDEPVMLEEQGDFEEPKPEEPIVKSDLDRTTSPRPVLRPEGLMAKPVTSDFEDRLANRIIELEGFIPEAERAFANEKHYTIGYGTYGPQVKKGQTITKAEAEVLLRETELPKRIKMAQDMFDNFDSFSDDLKIELIQGMYRGDFKKTHKTVQLINEGKWEEASKEFLNHKEYQTAKELGDKSDRAGIVPRLESISSAIYQEQFI